MMNPEAAKSYIQATKKVQTKDSDSKETKTSNSKTAEVDENKVAVNSNWEKFKNTVNKPAGTSKTPPKRPFKGSSKTAQSGKKATMDLENKTLTKHVAMDCEMVGIGDGTESMLARVSIVNRHGACIYDKYVKPRETVRDYRTAVSGIRPHNLQDGEDFSVVQNEVAEILKGRILVGHALKNDLAVLFLSHPKRHLRDTSRYNVFRRVSKGNTPSLKKLAAELLGIDIQTGEHNSIEDARIAMELYVLYKNRWESDIRH
ncbi:Similar to Rexo4: RNA exonuclease 4 (Mus musculus) [Cotesia congregata]|uniref:RNA exonuclease 4 n=1 Tax=Cotesia congregata TaxID=51543 RepID=A0A8J2MM51_COTCN|nr:Similar to Rexo4: RNA exonuclease 4 (Mus musculus) [Cotesia congregata]